MDNTTANNTPNDLPKQLAHIVLLGQPISTNSLYRHARGITYMTKAGRMLKESYKEQTREQFNKTPLSYDLEVLIELFFNDKRRRDWDNYHKLSCDALNAVVWDDDCQVQKATILKQYDKTNPRIDIKIYKHDK